jgi:hypothetical protein
MLESTKARQAKEIRDLRRKLRESRLVLPPQTFTALEQADPIRDIGPDAEDEDEEDDSDENDVTQTQADETYARVRLLLDGLVADAKTALEAEPICLSVKAGTEKPSIRVLNVHEVKEYVNGKDETDELDETDQSKATESVAGDLESIDGVTPLSENPPASTRILLNNAPPTQPQIINPPTTPKFEPPSFAGLNVGIRRWS